MLERAEAVLAAAGTGRAVLGIAGAPACGKSTLTDLVVAELARCHPGAIAHVGMDAFHIGHRVLERRGLVGLKGAPQTFDPEGYLALLRRVRTDQTTIYAPAFHREIEDSIAHEVEIGPEARLLVTEGNYLLLSDPPWDRIRPLLDEAWFVHLSDVERRRRLLDRHLRYGHARAEAEARTHGSDEANAVLVNRTGWTADVWVDVVV